MICRECEREAVVSAVLPKSQKIDSSTNNLRPLLVHFNTKTMHRFQRIGRPAAVAIIALGGLNELKSPPFLNATTGKLTNCCYEKPSWHRLIQHCFPVSLMQGHELPYSPERCLRMIIKFDANLIFAYSRQVDEMHRVLIGEIDQQEYLQKIQEIEALIRLSKDEIRNYNRHICEEKSKTTPLLQTVKREMDELISVENTVKDLIRRYKDLWNKKERDEEDLVELQHLKDQIQSDIASLRIQLGKVTTRLLQHE
jgi:hypothetical protein